MSSSMVGDDGVFYRKKGRLRIELAGKAERSGFR